MRSLSLLVALCLSLSADGADVLPPVTEGQRVLTCGHSFHVFTYRQVGEMVRGINERLGKNAVVVVPVGQASVTLREKIVKGEAPGLKAQSDLFRDTWGHALQPLQILSSYCHFAVIYRRSPVGLPVPGPIRALKEVSEEAQAKLNTLLQEIAWETVSRHPMAGVMSPR